MKKEQLDDIIKIISEEFDISEESLFRKRRSTDEVCRAKHVLYRTLFDMYKTKSKVGEILKKDHTTIMHGLKEYDNLYELHENFRYRANRVDGRVRGVIYTDKVALTKIKSIKMGKIIAEKAALIVAEGFGVTYEDLLSTRKMLDIANARLTLYKLLYSSGMTFKEVGKFVGGRHHSTVISGVDKFSDLYETDHAFREKVDSIFKIAINQTHEETNQ